MSPSMSGGGSVVAITRTQRNKSIFTLFYFGAFVARSTQTCHKGANLIVSF